MENSIQVAAVLGAIVMALNTGCSDDEEMGLVADDDTQSSQVATSVKSMLQMVNELLDPDLQVDDRITVGSGLECQGVAASSSNHPIEVICSARGKVIFSDLGISPEGIYFVPLAPDPIQSVERTTNGDSHISLTLRCSGLESRMGNDLQATITGELSAERFEEMMKLRGQIPSLNMVDFFIDFSDEFKVTEAAFRFAD